MAAGCAKVYQEKVSGARTDRAELGKVLKRIEAGDIAANVSHKSRRLTWQFSDMRASARKFCSFLLTLQNRDFKDGVRHRRAVAGKLTPNGVSYSASAVARCWRIEPVTAPDACVVVSKVGSFQGSHRAFRV